jgi:hypothetical protein
MHNLFLVYMYFFNLYMFQAYLGPSSGGTTECIQQLVLVILFRCLSVVLVGLEFQLDAQLILSIFRQPLHVSGVSRSIIRRYNRMYTTIGTYCYF